MQTIESIHCGVRVSLLLWFCSFWREISKRFQLKIELGARKRLCTQRWDELNDWLVVATARPQINCNLVPMFYLHANGQANAECKRDTVDRNCKLSNNTHYWFWSRQSIYINIFVSNLPKILACYTCVWLIGNKFAVAKAQKKSHQIRIMIVVTVTLTQIGSIGQRRSPESVFSWNPFAVRGPCSFFREMTWVCFCFIRFNFF